MAGFFLLLWLAFFFYFLFAQPAAVHKYLRRWPTLCKLNMHALRNQGYQCERRYALRHQPWQHCITKNFGSRQLLQKNQNNVWGASHHATVASKHSSDDKKSCTYKLTQKTEDRQENKQEACDMRTWATMVRHNPLCCAGGHHHFGTSRCLWMLFVIIGF